MRHVHHRALRLWTLGMGLAMGLLTGDALLPVPPVQAQASCTHNASTQTEINTFLANAQPGQTLCIANGRNYGPLFVDSNVVGTAAQPITIRALNDGQVTFHGGTSRAGWIRGTHVTIEGMNFANSQGDTALAIAGWSIIARRVVAWSYGVPLNGGIMMAGDHSLLEDCAAFGSGRYPLSTGADAPGYWYNVVRRCFAQAQISEGVTVALMMGYGQNAATMENVITNTNMQSGNVDLGPNWDSWRTKDSRVMGLISYALQGDVLSGLFRANLNGGSEPQASQNTERMHLRHILAYYHPQNFFYLQGRPGIDLYLDTSSFIEDAISVALQHKIQPINATNVHTGSDLATVLQEMGASNVWEALPGICKRYTSSPGDSTSTLTNEGLWGPWPMNQRIKDAYVEAGLPAFDLEATMESLFGPIPSACKTGTPVASPGTGIPGNLRVLQVQ